MNLDQPVSAIMTTEVVTVNPDQKILDVKHIYEKRSFHHHVPVEDNGKLVGIISLIDFMRHIGNATLDNEEEVYHSTLVRNIMTKRPVTASPDDSIRKVCELFSTGEFHGVVVVSDGKIEGIVTNADILKYILEQDS